LRTRREKRERSLKKKELLNFRGYLMKVKKLIQRSSCRLIQAKCMPAYPNLLISTKSCKRKKTESLKPIKSRLLRMMPSRKNLRVLE